MSDAQRSERIVAAETRMVKNVLPSTTNNHGTLFGGTLLSWMDEVAFVTATRFGRCMFVTVSIDRTDFKLPIPAASIVELVGHIDSVGRTSLKVLVDVYVEGWFADERVRAVTGVFTMVAVDDDQRPMPLPY